MLAVGSRLIVLGEVGEDPEGAAGDVVLRKAAPSSILDLKTTSISRPFVVSTKTEQGLLQVRRRRERRSETAMYIRAVPPERFISCPALE